jgi:hypothetical protein
MASTPGDTAKLAASDTPENHANAPVEKAPDDGSKLKTFLGILRKYVTLLVGTCYNTRGQTC